MSDRMQTAIDEKRAEIVRHIATVQDLMGDVLANLQRRAFRHDRSKTQEPEWTDFALLKLRKSEADYGEASYQARLDEAIHVIAHHYALNDHHPEHHADGVNGMSLLSMLEMLCDWKAASGETLNGSLEKSLRVNTGRFGLDPQTVRLLENTAKELGWM